MEQQLKAHVPLNSTPEQVSDYLNQRKIAHSAYRVGEDGTKLIEAEIPVKTSRALVQPSYEVEFHFNEANRLASYQVHYLGYLGF